MKVLSLFDGMACGMLAMMATGIEVERYVAYEIDKYAVQTSTHNFPMIEHKGDVFQADFTLYEGFDFLVGGSPCTYWSIAQTKNRETTASGMGWELFSQYVRALNEAKPKYFIYENNKSMSKDIRASITDTFGFEPICINSALVSAQNRQRLYWVGIRNEDGTYKKAEIEQPEDRGILLKHILETTSTSWLEKAHTIDVTYYKGGTLNSDKLHQNASRLMAAEPISGGLEVLNINPSGRGINGAVIHTESKSRTLTTNKGERQKIIEPICVAQRGRYFENPKARVAGLPTEQMYEAREDQKTNTLTTVQKDNMVAEPICTTKDGKSFVVTATEYKGSNLPHTLDKKVMTLIAEPVFASANFTDAVIEKKQLQDRTLGTMIYEVKDGLIIVKDRQYPIKLADGYYIIRKLTVRECMRLQTVPEWYEFPVSNSQAYKMLGNGWTVDVIAHILRGLKEENE